MKTCDVLKALDTFLSSNEPRWGANAAWECDFNRAVVDRLAHCYAECLVHDAEQARIQKALDEAREKFASERAS